MKKIIGVYQILNLTNGKSYVGSSSDIKVRFSMHKSYLKNNKHSNPYLQNAWNKYGEMCFKFSILEECDISELETREQWWCDYYKVNGGIYNLRVITKSNHGIKVSDETRKRMSDSAKNRPIMSDETRKKISKSNKGKKKSPCSDETKEKLTGQKRTDEQKQKMSEVAINMNKEKRKKIDESRKNPSDETKKKMSEAKQNMSDETRKKMSESGKGKKRSDETRKKMSEAKLNMSDETRKKMSEANTGKKRTDEQKQRMSDSQQNMSDETKKRISDSQKKRWKIRKI